MRKLGLLILFVALIIALVSIIQSRTFFGYTWSSSRYVVPVISSNTTNNTSNETVVLPPSKDPVVKPPVKNIAEGTIYIGDREQFLETFLTPLEIVQDSRCPTNVVCIWAGTAEVKVKIETPYQTAIPTITLGQFVTVGSYKIEFISMNPSPNTEQPIGPKGYALTFRVSRI